MASRSGPSEALCRECHGALRGNRPPQGDQFPSDGHDHVSGVLPSGDASSLAVAQPSLRLPTASLDRLGELCEPELAMATHLGRRAGGPGAFTQCPACLRVARLGHAALTTTRPAGIGSGCEPEIPHAWSRVLKASEVAACRHRGHGDGALDTTQAVEGVDHRGEPPGLDRVVQCQLQALKPGRGCGDRGPVFLQDALRCRGGPDDLTEPPAVRWPPGGWPRRAESGPQEKRLAPKRGGLESTDDVVTGPAQVPHGCILHRRDRDRRQGTRTHEPGQLERVTTVGCDPSAGLLGAQ